MLTSAETSPYLSIIIPTYNRTISLRRVLAALTTQRNVEPGMVEVIIIDDGSTDDTDRTVISFSNSSIINLRYIRQSSRGPAAARNNGIIDAKGEIILIMGDDIIASPFFLYHHIYSHRILFPNSNIAILGYSPLAGRANRPTLIQNWLNRKQMAFQNLHHMEEASYHYFYTCNISLKRDFLISNGLFDESYRYAAGEDTELGYRLSKKAGLKIVYNEMAVGLHVHEISFLQFLKRYFYNGKASTTSRTREIPMPELWRSSRNKLSPFHGVGPLCAVGFSVLYALSVFSFLLGSVEGQRST